MRKRILVVKDVNTLSPSLQETMMKQTFEPIVVEGLAHALKGLRDHRPALIIFEVLAWTAPYKELLWEMNELTSAWSVRKMILSASGGMDEKAAALEMGADEFLTNPISARELEAKIAAVLRSQTTILPEEAIQAIGHLRLDRDAMELTVAGIQTVLSYREFHLLAYMMEHLGRVLSRQDLLQNVWHPDGMIEDPRVVDVYICRLRDKIEIDPSDPKILLTRRREGYSLVDPSKHP
jgi:two-component system response regulator VicR